MLDGLIHFFTPSFLNKKCAVVKITIPNMKILGEKFLEGKFMRQKARKFLDKCRNSEFIKNLCKGGSAGLTFISTGGSCNVDNYFIS